MSREIFLLAGEASGDLRGSELIRALKKLDSDLRFSGMGGPLMKEAGMEVLADVTGLAVVGVFEVLKHYSLFRSTMEKMIFETIQRRPAAVVTIDYPGFNLRFQKRIRAESSLSIRQIQYISPQLWAWKEDRKWGMAHYLDEVLCLFPFEPQIFQGTGLATRFVGHPLATHPSTGDLSRDPQCVAFFPGSRRKELEAHLPVLMELESRLRLSHPELQIQYASNSDSHSAHIRLIHPGANTASASDLQNRAWYGVVCSGTATLECALAGLPMCVIYKVAWPTYWMGRALIRVPCLAMPNILAGHFLVREWIQNDFTADHLEMECHRLQQPDGIRKKIQSGYEKIRSQLDAGNSTENTARAILQHLD